MKIRSAIVTIGIAGILAGGAVAQHEEHHPDQASPQSNSPMRGGMMQGGMMAHMPQMMSDQKEIGKLVDQLVTSFAAIRNEKNSGELKKKFAAHEALLQSLQAKVQAQSQTMDMMHQMMRGSMMGGDETGGSKK
jgi:hypothetical protein